MDLVCLFQIALDFVIQYSKYYSVAKKKKIRYKMKESLLK